MAGFQRVLDGIQDTSFSLLGRKQKEEADYVYENANSGAGIKDMLPGILETVGRHFRHLRFRADSASYDKDIARGLDCRGEVRRKPTNRRRKRKNHKRALLNRRKPHRKIKGEPHQGLQIRPWPLPCTDGLLAGKQDLFQDCRPGLEHKDVDADPPLIKSTEA